MSADLDCRGVLAFYPEDCQPHAAEFLGSAGGFSGALFWRLEAPAGRLCLRRWPPEHPSPERLEFIHSVLRHVHEQGFHEIPLPLLARGGRSFVRHAGHLWELVPWLAGQADYHLRPTRARLAAALEALARFHLAAASFPQCPAGESRSPSPGIAERRAQLQRLLEGGLAELRRAVVPGVWPELESRAELLAQLFPQAAPPVACLLDQAAALGVPLQPCLRDVWHDHVLFDGENVSGLIDFGAVRFECVAADVARLLASLVGDDPAGRQEGLAAYQRWRPLEAAEQTLLAAFDESAVLLTGVQWLRWVYQERRRFADRTAVVARIDAVLERLARRGLLARSAPSH